MREMAELKPGRFGDAQNATLVTRRLPSMVSVVYVASRTWMVKRALGWCRTSTKTPRGRDAHAAR